MGCKLNSFMFRLKLRYKFFRRFIKTIPILYIIHISILLYIAAKLRAFSNG